MIYKPKKQYRPIMQMPYSCVPATLQWILYRRGLDILDQESIGVDLGLTLPLKCKTFFKHKNIIFTDNAPDTGYGTQIQDRKYSIDKFFLKNRIPLHISPLIIFKEQEGLEEFIKRQLTLNKDIILRYNNAITQNDNQKSYGHFSVITNFEDQNKQVVIGDPEMPFFKKVSLEEIIFAISDKIDSISRGLYVVSSTAQYVT